jgi:hypothetical protein
MDRSELLRLARLGAQARLNAGRGVKLAASAPARKGRRKMSAAERKAVSERMTKYWAARRKAKKQG